MPLNLLGSSCNSNVGVRAIPVFLARLIFVALLVVKLSPTTDATDIIVFTEHIPPYSFKDPDGQVVGTATDRVRKFLGALPVSYEIRQVPWNRAYELSRQLDNALVYPIMRLPSREDQFHWLVEVQQSDLHIYGRADEARPVTMDALRRGELIAVCVIGDAACELFQAMGVPDARILEVAYDQRVELQIIQSGRGDIFIAQEDEFQELAVGVDHQIDKLMRLGGEVQFCLAAGVKMRSELLTLLQEAVSSDRAFVSVPQ